MNNLSTKAGLAHPEAVLRAKGIGPSEKRQQLAAWASDINAVPDHPALRRIADGTTFHIDDLMEALKAADQPRASAQIMPFPRRARDEDDDPGLGAAAAWPTLPPVVIDARARAWRCRQGNNEAVG